MELRMRYLMASLAVDSAIVALLLYYMLNIAVPNTILGFIVAFAVLKVVAEKAGLHMEIEKRVK